MFEIILFNHAIRLRCRLLRADAVRPELELRQATQAQERISSSYGELLCNRRFFEEFILSEVKWLRMTCDCNIDV